MGEKHVSIALQGEQLRAFTSHLLDDLRALERMIESGMIEGDVRRVGAEQELFLVDRNWRPALAAQQILERLDHPHFTTELGRFNLEFNLDPLHFGDDCLRRLETDLREHMALLESVAADVGLLVTLTGILPTLRISDLGLEGMVPEPRYLALNEALNRLRGTNYEFHIKGLDELILHHDSVMLEACNASFQVHFQVAAEEFAWLYNIAQVAAAPVMAAAANSPLLFGRRLWRETRIALFQQSVDTRRSIDHLRERSPRVMFGRGWVQGSVLDIYREDVARFPALLGIERDEDAGRVLDEGGVPKLRALTMHNSTVYRWNRPCYGITDGKPHLRIENRILPSGPTVLDEVANAAFWFGVIGALSDAHEDITEHMDFEDARINFQDAARLGLRTELKWLGGEILPARTLICERLLPAASDALMKRGIDGDDVARYLSVIDRRVRSGQNGAEWLLTSLDGMRAQGTEGERLHALVAATIARQRGDAPVSEWAPATLDESGGWQHTYLKVEQYMTTELFTVHEDEPIELVANLMDWRGLRHVAVEDHEHHLVGIVSYRALLRLMARGMPEDVDTTRPVAGIMRRDPVSVTPEASTVEAITLMRDRGIGALPVVKNGRLIGMVTERSFMKIARQLLEERLSGPGGGQGLEGGADEGVAASGPAAEPPAPEPDGMDRSVLPPAPGEA